MPALDVDGDPGATPGSAGSIEPAARAMLLERDAELELLRDAVHGAVAGRSQVVVVEGPAGIGKTRLLAEARGLAQAAGLRVLRARGSELEREFAFGVVRQLFGPVTSGSEQSPLADAAMRELFELAGPGGVEDGTEDRSFALLHGLHRLTAGLAGDGPLGLMIDDLHCCDAGSLRFLAYLVRRLEDLPVLVVCSIRPGERSDSPALEGVRSDPLTVLIRPGTLSPAATTELVAARFSAAVDAAFARACHGATGGSPLLLHELLETLVIEGVRPDAEHVAEVSELGVAASRAVLARLVGLSPEAVRLARAAAVLGDDAELSIVAALAEVSLERAVLGVAELARVEVLDSRPSLRFVHPLVGEAVYRDMPGTDQALWHARAAQLLADAGGDPERVAAHLLQSPARGRPEVVQALVAAARGSIRNGSPESAVAYFRRALREPPPPSQRAAVLLELGRAATLTHGLSAIEHLTQAYELLSDPGSRAVAAHALARVLLRTGDPDQAARLARTAAAQLPAELEDARRQLEALELMALLVAGGSDGSVLERLRQHRQTPVGPGLGVKMLAAMAAQAWALAGGTGESCAELALGALAGGELIAADAGLLAVGPIEILALADRQEAIDASRRALTQARAAGSLFDLISAGLWRSYVLYCRGQLTDAEQLLRNVEKEAELWGIAGPAKLSADAALSAVLRERGKLDEARQVLEQSSDPGNDGEATRCWMHSQLELLVAEGRMHEAISVAELFETRFSPACDAVNTPWRPATALALHRLGREQEAVALAHEEVSAARRWGAPSTVARALLTLGTVQGEGGIEALEQAVRTSAGTPAQLQHAKALAAFGGALRRSRRRADARVPLREALDLAEALGADGLAEHVRSELYATGARLRSTALRGVAALTPSERRVAALAALGRTNREIAQQLYVTPKTVEMHLSRCYAKLQISSRRELEAHADELQESG